MVRYYKDYSQEVKQSIADDIRNANLTFEEICSKHKISYRIYKKVKEEFNLQRKISIREKQFTCNEGYFKCINSEDKAYWLGFLYADGSILKIGEYYITKIQLAEQDRDHVIKFKNSIDATQEVNDYISKEGWKSSRIVIGSKIIFDDLTKLGCVEKKTLILVFTNEEQVPKQFIQHFMRGYFDGDGTINIMKQFKTHQARFQLLGTENFIKGFIERLPLSKQEKLEIHLQDTKNIKTIQVAGNNKAKKIFDFLYDKANIYLDRKYEKYIDHFYR